ncbi:DUF1080 domain-containing protein [Aliifodinibius sp. S!AR15-10]|uniref:3-keto-disaccharide hydrolase n=1 Tax=Aliifodinibius sp. S!AR15-10 TaxID=2950437 RepID=UPI0028672F20|nr:DUF1080 domain-containing protein [Aliifodinibius sp. S!AR15-10]MDR8389920.1 DUF1080 domain-containing protein [Aliifodinibius sp. S!AR15-10]
MKKKEYSFSPFIGMVVLMFILFFSDAHAQDSDTIVLDDWSHFKAPAGSWQTAGRVTASLDSDNTITVSNGDGILVNNPQNAHGGEDLYTKLEHGDIDLSLDYLMPKASNSGIYLQGRYELQLHDSWTVKVPSSSDNGGIYERPAEAKGPRQGKAPRQNVSRAPGLWQHLELSFRAPRFNEKGLKVANARLLRAELNGVVIHEDVELVGPTAGVYGDGEVPEGPLRFQGDHGPVAFRNIKITRYDRPVPSVKDLEYHVYEGVFTEEPNLNTLTTAKSGTSELLTPNLGSLPEQFLLHYSGTLHIEEAGKYNFDLDVADGDGVLRVANKEIIGMHTYEGSVALPKGGQSFELLYARRSDWKAPGFELMVSSDGMQRHLLSERQLAGQNDPNPIYVHASEKPVLRSFMDLPGGSRITHAVSVSSLDKLHYTYDLNHGNVVQLWRGDFLDVTPMWYDRGDGSSLPNGSVEHLLEEPALVLNKLENEQAIWKTDTTGTGFKTKGYTLDDRGNPRFTYTVFETTVEDKVRTVRDGGGFKRTMRLKGNLKDVYLRIATGQLIQQVEKNRYLIDDQSYYIQTESLAGSDPFVREIDGHQELILLARPTINYTILF